MGDAKHRIKRMEQAAERRRKRVGVRVFSERRRACPDEGRERGVYYEWAPNGTDEDRARRWSIAEIRALTEQGITPLVVEYGERAGSGEGADHGR